VKHSTLEAIMSTKQRDAKAEPAYPAGLWGNAVLALFKGIVGLLSGSKTLLADGFRSAAECAAAFVAPTGMNAGDRQQNTSEVPAIDRNRAETFTTIIISVVFLVLGLEIGISAIRDIASGVEQPPHWSALAAVVAGIIVKELFLPGKERMVSLVASLAGVVGVGGALAGQVLSEPKLYYFDPAGALVIAIIVLYNGYRIIIDALHKDRARESRSEDAEELMQLIQRVEGVITVESLQAKEQGHYVVAEIVISVNPRITVLEGNEIAKRVKQLLLKRFGHVTEVTIYVEPYNPGYPYKSNHDPNQEYMPTMLQ